MLTMRYTFLRWIVFYEMDGRDNRYIKEVFDCYRDALDLEESELNELFESMTRLNGLQVESEKSGKSEDMHRGENPR